MRHLVRILKHDCISVLSATIVMLCVQAVAPAAAQAPIYLRIETSTGSDTLHVGCPETLTFRVDSVDGRIILGMTWALVFSFSNGNIVGPLVLDSNVFLSDSAVSVYDVHVWDSGYGVRATDPDSIGANFVDFGSGPFWTYDYYFFTATFTPSDTGTILIDSAKVPPYQTNIVAPLGSPPFSWAPRSFTVVQVGTAGDLNADSIVTTADIIYLVNYVFKGSDPPIGCLAVVDVNCSGQITAADIIKLVGYVFKGQQMDCDICYLIESGFWNCP